MDRRLVGVVVLVLALTAVMVLPSVTGRRVAGAAVATVLPDPPQVGECLLAPLPQSVAPFGWPRKIPYAPSDFGSCAGEIAGEIVALWSTEAEADEGARSRSGGPCYRQAAAYAGLVRSGRTTVVPGAPTEGPVAWKPSIGFTPYRVVPGEIAQNAGQSWVACLAVPTSESSYEGRLRDAYTIGAMDDVFALCWSDHDLDSTTALLACDQPHATELLATGWIRDRSIIEWLSVEASCIALAGSIMHAADATRDGALTIVVDKVRLDGASRPDAPLAVNCFVTSTGPQQLTGTVVGLGDRPIPFEQ